MDAADGRIDGTSYGRPVAQAVPAPYYGGGPGVAVAANAQQAYAMDAADGRIDGRAFGAPVVNTNQPYGYGSAGMVPGQGKAPPPFFGYVCL